MKLGDQAVSRANTGLQGLFKKYLQKIVSLKINKDAIDPEDPEMLEDLITTAVNEAGKKADDMVQKGMSKVTGGLGLPGGMF